MAYSQEEQDRLRSEAEQKYGGERVSQWLSQNPGDVGRIDSAFQSDNTSSTNDTSGGGGSSGFSQTQVPKYGGWTPTWSPVNIQGNSGDYSDYGQTRGAWGGSVGVNTGVAGPTYSGVPTAPVQPSQGSLPTGGFTGIGGQVSPQAPGGMTKEQVIAMVDEMKTNGLKGDPNFDLYYGIGKTPQQMIDYMNTFSQYGNWAGGTPQTAGPQQPHGPGTRRNEMYDMLMSRAQQGLNVNPNDPAIKGQVDAYRGEQERMRRNLQSDYAEGGKSLSDTQKRMSHEAVGHNVGSLQAQLVANERQARRDEIAQALSLNSQFLTDGEKLALQRELGMLDNEIKRNAVNLQSKELDLQSQLGLGNLELQRQLGMGGLENDLMRALMQNQQFYSDLGYRSANSAAEWDARRGGY